MLLFPSIFLYHSRSLFVWRVVVVVVFTLKTVLTSVQYLLFLNLQGKETNFRGQRLSENKVQKNNDKNKNKRPRESPTLARKILYRFLKITGSEKTRSRSG